MPIPLQCFPMHGLPVMLNLAGQRCLIVGGGPVAVRRARALLAAGANGITVIAPQISSELREMPVKIEMRTVRDADLVEMRLVVLATGDAMLQDRLARLARSMGVLVNRADDADDSEIRFMSTNRCGPITIAVDSGSALPDAARAIGRELSDAIDPVWPAMLAIAGPCRRIIRMSFAAGPARRQRIGRLTDSFAVNLFKMQGELAYRALCQALCDPDSTCTTTNARESA